MRTLGVEADATAVIPGEHVGGLVGLEQTMAAEVAQDPGADGALRRSKRCAETAVASWKRRPAAGSRGPGSESSFEEPVDQRWK